MKLRLIAVLFAVAACDVPVETTAYAHESPSDTPTVIDGPPMAALQNSTFLGGNGVDEITAVALTQPLYPQVTVVGETHSPFFPTSDGTQLDTTAQANCSACPADLFVTRLRSSAERAWSTVIGGPGFERATAVVAAANGDVFVGGSAASLPMTANAADPTFAGGSTAERGEEDGFVCRLSRDDGQPRWCTFVGGSGSGGVLGLAVDTNADDVIVVLVTSAAEALHADPSYAAAFAGRYRATPQGADVAVLRLSGDGTAFEWATYVGGSGDEVGAASVALDGDGVHVLVTTTSTDAPTPNGRITSAPAGRNAYFATLSSDATTLRYGTYLGGAGDDWSPPNGLLATTILAAAVNTTSNDMPVANAAQPTYGGGAPSGDCGAGDGWVGVILPSAVGAASLPHATYVGGSFGDEISGIARLGTGEIVVTGHTFSTDFPTAATYLPFQEFIRGSPCTTAPGNSDGFLVRYEAGSNPPLQRRRIATYIGGSAADRFVAAVGGNGEFHALAGWSSSTDFPLRLAAQSTLIGGRDGVVCAPEYWLQEPVLNDDIVWPSDGPPAADANRDGGNGADGDGDGGCCGASGAPASSTILLAIAALATLISRGRRARADTASARDRGAP